MKRIVWVRNSKADLKRFPAVVQKHIGVGLMVAQMGEKHPDAKLIRGFGGASVIEVIEDHDGDTYRAVYTVRFAEALYVLPLLSKEIATRGIATDRRDIDRIKERLKRPRICTDSE